MVLSAESITGTRLLLLRVYRASNLERIKAIKYTHNIVHSVLCHTAYEEK